MSSSLRENLTSSCDHSQSVDACSTNQTLPIQVGLSKPPLFLNILPCLNSSNGCGYPQIPLHEGESECTSRLYQQDFAHSWNKTQWSLVLANLHIQGSRAELMGYLALVHFYGQTLFYDPSLLTMSLYNPRLSKLPAREMLPLVSSHFATLTDV